jgi:DNA modification methylase
VAQYRDVVGDAERGDDDKKDRDIMISLANADSRHIPLADQSVQCVITSPPYWGLRSYNTGDNKHMEIGAEPTPAAYVASIVAVMRECWRVLRDDGTAWLNLGDSYYGNKGESNFTGSDKRGARIHNFYKSGDGLKPKDLVGIPWRVAFALQDDGWYLRSDIVWFKPNPVPEPIKDRPTRAHEFIFLLSKSERYFYDQDSIRTKTDRINSGGGKKYSKLGQDKLTSWTPNPLGSNARDVWEIPVNPYSGAHFATFPPALVEPMVLAGSRKGDTVLDPFAGSGTVGEVCRASGRHFIGLDLSTTYLTENAMPRAMNTNTAASMATLPIFTTQLTML